MVLSEVKEKAPSLFSLPIVPRDGIEPPNTKLAVSNDIQSLATSGMIVVLSLTAPFVTRDGPLSEIGRAHV